jgi:type IV secretory pathway TrbF-like protein
MRKPRTATPPISPPPGWRRPVGEATRRRARQRAFAVIVGIVTAVLLASGLVVVLDRWLK